MAKSLSFPPTTLFALLLLVLPHINPLAQDTTQSQPKVQNSNSSEVVDVAGNPLNERNYYKIISVGTEAGLGLVQDRNLCPLYVAVQQPSNADIPIDGPLELSFREELGTGFGPIDHLLRGNKTVYRDHALRIEFRSNSDLKCNKGLWWAVQDGTVRADDSFVLDQTVLNENTRFKIRKADITSNTPVYKLQQCSLSIGDNSCEDVGTRVNTAISTSPLLVVGYPKDPLSIQFVKV